MSMRFHLRAIKEVHDTEYNINTIISFPDAQTLEQFLSEHKILAISQEAYTQDHTWFGDIYGSIAWQGAQYDFVLDAESIVTALRTLVSMGFDVVAINSHRNPLSVQDAITSIKNITAEVQTTLDKAQQQIHNKTKQLKQSYTSKKAEHIQQSITQVLQDADFATKTYTQNTTLIRKLSEKIEELKKMRLSKNTEKLTEIIEKVYHYINLMEQEYLQSLPQEPIAADTSISIPWFVSLYDRRQRARKMATITGSWWRYAHLWSWYITTKLLIQDIQYHFVQRRKHPQSVMQFVVFVALFATVMTVVWWLLLAMFASSTIGDLVGLWLMRLGIVWLSVWVWYLVARKYMWHSTSVIVLSILLFVCLHYIMVRLFLLYHI